ncbi:hypothetical protein GCM10009747_24630 [Agromyces humatus]|uniref:YchF C-terminal domain-containing protein n=1 Tax=Agromyces humatus TaxID=279573 RepID=A0ABP4WZW6_9MICO
MERGERDAEGIGGTWEVQLLGNGDETSKQGDVHGEPFVDPRVPRPISGYVSRPARALAARMEGKDYVMQDGDVVEFRFNV